MVGSALRRQRRRRYQRGNAVLIGEADWQAIQETLSLQSVPGFVESVRRARADGVEAASTELDW